MTTEGECARQMKNLTFLPELDPHDLKMTHTAGTSGLPPLGLNGPVV